MRIPRVVSKQAKWVMHADVQKLKQTQLGAFLQQEAGTGEVQRRLEAIQSMFNLDPRKDIQEITAYGKGGQGEEAVALVRDELSGLR